MSISREISAAAAIDVYNDRPQSDVDKQKEVLLNNTEYHVIGYKDDPVTGFHGTAYLNKDTNEVVIAYRGTDPDFKNHPGTMAQDIAVDATMVRDLINPQEPAASAFTKEMLDKAKALGIPQAQVTVAGHSLGGTVAEIEAAKFHLRGTTLNAFGAADLLGYNVPEGGTEVTNYVMAGDVVSAASHHYGTVVPLASNDDIQRLKMARYLDAAPGAPPPNPLLAMSLSDHSGGHFTGPDSVLKPENLAQHGKNYSDNKAAIDAFRGDVYRDRCELSDALRQAQSEGAQAKLPPDIRRQLDEYLTLNADPAIQNGVEQNSKVAGVNQGLQQAADAVRGGGQYVQSQDERAASVARIAGNFVAPVNPAAPLVGAALGEGVHLQGQATHAAGDYAANQLQSTKQAVEHGAHIVSEAVKAEIHSPGVQAAVVKTVNNVVDTYRVIENAGHDVEQTYRVAKHAVSQGIQTTEQNAERAYDGAKQAVSHGAEATEHGASQTYDKLTHPGRWFHHDAPSAPAQINPASTPLDPQTQAITPPEPGYARNDPRHPDNPHHGLYEQLKERIPEAGENRLLQFTAACHAKGITDQNIGQITYLREQGVVQFRTEWEPRAPAMVDVKTTSPEPQQSIQRIQQTDHQQAQTHAHIQAQNAQISQQQGQQGPVPGMR